MIVGVLFICTYLNSMLTNILLLFGAKKYNNYNIFKGSWKKSPNNEPENYCTEKKVRLIFCFIKKCLDLLININVIENKYDNIILYLYN